MATGNPFGLLVDEDNDDLTQLLAKVPVPAATAGKAQPNATAKSQPQAKLPSKPLPPSEAVREARNEGGYRGGRGGGRFDGRGRGSGGRGVGRGFGRGFGRDSADENDNSYPSRHKTQEDSEAGERRPYGAPRGPRRGGYSNGEEVNDTRGPRRPFDRHSATGRGNEMKRDGVGSYNWGAPGDEDKSEPFANQDTAKENTQKSDEETAQIVTEKQADSEAAGDADKDAPVDETEEKKKEPEEEKEMTLEEYEKVLEEKRKALLEMKPEERKVNLDKELASMQLLSSKKSNDEIFVKLGSDKDKRKEAVERAKKAPVNLYMKPAEGDSYNRGGRGRGRGGGRGDAGQGKYGNHKSYNVEAPKIEDVGQFPSLGGK